MTEAEVKPTVSVGTFQVTLNLSDKRGLSMTGHVYLDDDAKALNNRIDFYQDVLDRQAVRADITNKKAQITGHQMNLKNYLAAFEEAVKKQKKGRKLQTGEQQVIDNYDAGVRRATEEIDSLQSAIDAAEKFLRGE